MKTANKVLVAAVLVGMFQSAGAAPWVYRGTLSDGGHEANGAYDLRVTLIGPNGALLAQPVTLNSVNVQKGRFQTNVDFGVDVASFRGAKIKTEVQQGGSGFVQLGDAKAVAAPASPNAGVCWDTEGNTGVSPALTFPVLGTIDAASDDKVFLKVRNENKLVMRASGGVETANSTALGLNAMALGSANAAAAGSFAVGGGRTSAGATSSFAYSSQPAAAVNGTPGYSNSPGEFLVNAEGGMGIHAVPSGYSTFNSSIADLTIGVRPNGLGNDVDIVLKNGLGSTGAISYTASGVFELFTTPISASYLRTNANGASLTNGGIWTNGSSRTFKTNFMPVNPLEILSKVVAMPVTSWNYKNSSEGLHVGPMAEDFKAAFGLGDDEKHIGTVDADGVALAAIQGLNLKLEASEQENAALKARLDALEARLK
jgi:hypothetical protein